MKQEELQELQAKITEVSAFAGRVKTEMNRIMSGQQQLIDRLLLALIADGQTFYIYAVWNQVQKRRTGRYYHDRRCRRKRAML